MNENIIDVLVYLFENYMTEHVNLKERYTMNKADQAEMAKPAPLILVLVLKETIAVNYLIIKNIHSIKDSYVARKMVPVYNDA